MTETADVAIIGGGAAGLAAAIFAAQSATQTRKIVVLDGAKSVGAKILVSGGGRCNVTHDVVTPEDFNGSRPVVKNILAAFPASATVQWFASLGVNLKREEAGKLFPVADSARVVLGALLRRCDELNIRIETGARMRGIIPPTDSTALFRIDHDRGSLHSARMIMATGGRSLPRSGSDGSGWDIVRALGHQVTPTYAALVPLVLDSKMFHASLAGIAMDVELSTFAYGKLLDHRRGSMLWTHFGISGPVVMDASRHWVIAHETGQKPQMTCNLLPGETFESVERWLIELGKSKPRGSVLAAIASRVPERVAGRRFLTDAGIDSSTAASQLAREARRELVHALTALPLPVVGHRGWNYAEVTAGGVPLNEIDYRTMESRKVPGLYLIGEMLDCEGRIGGFNFQWAWATGHLAGKAAAK